jgi:hypothetical protein
MEGFPEKYRYDLNIINATREQILRDLNLAGTELSLSGDPYKAYEELKIQLTPFIRKKYNQDKISFQSLLYRVDVSEKDFKNSLTPDSTDTFEEKISELIIRREFQKVITRKYFSEKNASGENK